MKFLIIPDSFKGSLGAFDVAKAIEKGIKNVLPKSVCKCIGMADGGEGSLDLWLSLCNAKQYEYRVSNAYGQPVRAQLGFEVNDKTAFVEVAQASGIAGIDKQRLNPLKASSYGTGELINYAVHLGAKDIIMALGGSATIDGATGLLQALGVVFTDINGKTIPQGANPLIDFYSFDIGPVTKLKDINWLLLTDVINPLTGINGAARVFGPQKGASDKMVELIDERLHYWNNQLMDNKGLDVEKYRGSGAAGGLGVPFLSLCNAKLESGFDWFSKIMGLERLLKDFDVVITGEGHLDNQTMMGKGPGKIAEIAKNAGCKVFAITGKNECSEILFDKVFELTNENVSTEMAMLHADELIEKAAVSCARFIAS